MHVIYVRLELMSLEWNEWKYLVKSMNLGMRSIGAYLSPHISHFPIRIAWMLVISELIVVVYLKFTMIDDSYLMFSIVWYNPMIISLYCTLFIYRRLFSFYYRNGADFYHMKLFQWLIIAYDKKTNFSLLINIPSLISALHTSKSFINYSSIATAILAIFLLWSLAIKYTQNAHHINGSEIMLIGMRS